MKGKLMKTTEYRVGCIGKMIGDGVRRRFQENVR